MTMPAQSAPLTVPGNLLGTLAGVAASLAVGALSHAGYLATAALAVGMPEATMTAIAMAIVGGVVNYGVTHVAAIKSLNDLYAMLPNTYAEYPADKNAPAGSATNLTSGNSGA